MALVRQLKTGVFKPKSWYKYNVRRLSKCLSIYRFFLRKMLCT